MHKRSADNYKVSRRFAIAPVLILFVFGLLFSSCIPQKDLTYLQTEEQTNTDSLVLPLNREIYLIQVNDILNITVRSYDPKMAAAFNTISTERMQVNGGEVFFYLTGYTVDVDGAIYLPVIGRVEVVGLTTSEIRDLLNQKLELYFQSEALLTSVQLSGIRFSVIGEVKRPGKYTIYQNQANIFEALAMAGDVNVYGIRNEIQIIRQYPEGVRLINLDLTEIDVLSDPNYMIQPNDIINVKPLPQRSWGIGETGFSTFVQSLSIISSVLLIAISLRNLSN